MTDEPRNAAMLRFLNEAFAEDGGWQAYVDDFYFGEDTAFPTTMHAEFEEVLTAAREIEMRRFLLRLGIPPIGPPACGPLPPLPDHIAYSLSAYRAIHGGQLPDLHEERERRTLYITQGRARTRA